MILSKKFIIIYNNFAIVTGGEYAEGNLLSFYLGNGEIL